MELGTIFTLDEYAEAYAYAVKNGFLIEEIEPKDGVRQYQIVAIPEPTEYEKAQARIDELKAEIAAVDYKQFKYLRGELTPEEWEQVKAYIQAKTAEINELEKLLTNPENSAIV